MRMRGVCAAAAGVVGAATAHALDVAGLLPGVHETAQVRAAMDPLATVAWLALAGALAWLAARTRPVLVGGASALIVSGIPELVGRHDPGAVAEPGAIAGALLQWVLLLAVVAVAMLLARSLTVRAPSYADLPWQPSMLHASAVVSRLLPRRGRPRAPPSPFLSVPVS
jgi:hypothetical protein